MVPGEIQRAEIVKQNRKEAPLCHVVPVVTYHGPTQQLAYKCIPISIQFFILSLGE